MAFIYWRLGDLARKEQPRDARYGVVRGRVVWDVDELGWDQGVRPGMPFAEMKWRYPGASWQPWVPEAFQPTRQALREWITERAAWADWDRAEAGVAGCWEWPRLERDRYMAWMQEIVPGWARRGEGGVAAFPALARWAMEAGTALELPCWRRPGFVTHVITPRQQNRLLPRLPLRYLAVEPEQARAWREQGWRVVGEVPHLLAQLSRGDTAWTWLGMPAVRSPALALWAWEGEFACPGVEGNGWLALAEAISHRLAEVLATRREGFCRLRLTWRNEQGDTVVRERRWPTAALDRRTVYARLIGEMGKGVPWPPIAVGVAIGELTAAEQLRWEFGRAGHGMGTPWPGVRQGMPTGRREQLLRHWDVWNWGVAT